MKYIITGGGTGGHLYPGIQIATELKSRGHEVLFIASKNGIDQDIFSKMTVDFPVEYWDLRGFARSFSPKAIAKNLQTGIKVVKTTRKASKLMKEFQPDFVIGMGGYISYPVVKAASKLQIKTAIHEQNSYPGVTNRQLAKIVDYVFYTYEKALDYFDLSNTEAIYTSNPRIDEARKYQTTTEIPDSVLFLGGSLGAETINDVAIKYAEANPNKTIDLVCGERYIEQMQELKLDNLQVHSYLTDQLKWMDLAQVVVTRSGATTLLEAIALNKLTLAIPSPNVVANHQYANAKTFSDLGYIELITEEHLSVEALSSKIDKLITEEKQYKAALLEFADVKSLATIINKVEE